MYGVSGTQPVGIGIEGVHGRAVSAPTSIEEVAQSRSLRKHLVGASNPDRIGTDEDIDLSPVAGDGDLLAGEHTVEGPRMGSRVTAVDDRNRQRTPWVPLGVGSWLQPDPDS